MMEFFEMGGHGFYIWMSYGIVVLMLGYNYVISIVKRKKLLIELSRFHNNNI